LIYLDACALVKFVKSERETSALRAWRQELQSPTELITSTLSQLEVTRTLLRAGVDHKLVPYYTGQALQGIYQSPQRAVSRLRGVTSRDREADPKIAVPAAA
jgi:hypothetical protein